MNSNSKRPNEDSGADGAGVEKKVRPNLVDENDGEENALFDLFGGSDNTYEKAASFKDMALGVYKLPQLKVVEHKANGTQYIGYVKDIDGKMALDEPVWLPSSISSKLSYDRVSYVNDKAKCGVFMYIENKGVQPGSSKKPNGV